MAAVAERAHQGVIHPYHAVVLAGTVPLFLGALLSDYAYWSSHHIQWSNFASWLLIGAMVLASITLVFEIVAIVRGKRNFTYTVVVAATWIVGFFDALHHGRDAWAIMPTALVLSVVATVLACVATWIGFPGLRAGGAR